MVYLVKDMEDFQGQLDQAGGKLVIVDFYATWCGPCKAIAPKIEEMEKEMTDVVFLKVDVDQSDDIAGKYEVSCMPTFVFIKNGGKVDSFSGANEAKVKELLQKHK